MPLMNKLRSVMCDTKDCGNQYTEKSYGDGFPDWGYIKGASNENGEEPWLCPECMVKHLKIINGEEK